MPIRDEDIVWIVPLASQSMLGRLCCTSRSTLLGIASAIRATIEQAGLGEIGMCSRCSLLHTGVGWCVVCLALANSATLTYDGAPGWRATSPVDAARNFSALQNACAERGRPTTVALTWEEVLVNREDDDAGAPLGDDGWWNDRDEEMDGALRELRDDA